jgi:hypothetical protein
LGCSRGGGNLVDRKAAVFSFVIKKIVEIKPPYKPPKKWH